MALAFQRLANWQPFAAQGWKAGEEWGGAAAAAGVIAIEALCLYPAFLTFTMDFGLVVSPTHPDSFRSAGELRITREVAAALAIAGEFLAEITGAGQVICAVALDGFRGAVSEAETGDNVGFGTRGLGTAPSPFDDATRATSLELRDTPETVGRRLLDRWIAAFCPEDDLDPWERLVPTTQRGGPQGSP